jgi:tRNA(Ile)-lysidine synthase
MKKQIDYFQLRHIDPHLPVAVAFSGGADSTALLHACLKRWPNQPGQAARVFAIHVHHGLQKAADGFAQHCEGVCKELGIPFWAQHVQAAHQSGESPEEQARLARYKAIASVVKERFNGEIKSVLLGQHADDQVETLILALSRGAGLPGLSAMAGSFDRMGITYHRPFLQLSADQIKDWLRAQGIGWIEDPTNTDTKYTRNKIRSDVIPSIAQAFPSFRQTFARSARHAAQAQTLLDELALEDLKITGNPPKIKQLQTFSAERQANALRFWFKSQGTSASDAQMSELLSQIGRCKTAGHQIEMKLGTGFVRKSGAALAWSELLQ